MMEIAKSARVAGRIVEVSEDWPIRAAAPDVWRKICEPCSLVEWHDHVVGCEPGTDTLGRLTRVYTLMAPAGAEPPTIHETELARFESLMAIDYVCVFSGLPLEDYLAQIAVTPISGAECRVRIRSRFLTYAPDEAAALVSRFYLVGLSRLAKLMER